jgi:hypothetical protein
MANHYKLVVANIKETRESTPSKKKPIELKLIERTRNQVNRILETNAKKLT